MNAKSTINALLSGAETTVKAALSGSEGTVALAVISVLRAVAGAFFDDGMSAKEILEAIKRPPKINTTLDDAEIDEMVKDKP